MTTQTDVLAKSVSGTGALSIGGSIPPLGVRIKTIYWSGGTTAGTLTFTDGGASGTARITVVVPTTAVNIAIPGEGVRFYNDPYVTYTNAVGTATVFYG
jgi:hypothetical protein